MCLYIYIKKKTVLFMFLFLAFKNSLIANYTHANQEEVS